MNLEWGIQDIIEMNLPQISYAIFDVNSSSED